jgi:hypothetical protein
MITTILTVKQKKPVDVTRKGNRIGVLHTLLRKAISLGIISKKHQLNVREESVLDLESLQVYYLGYEQATYVREFELVIEED